MEKNKAESPKDKGNIYDRMFKENAKNIFIPLVEQELGIKISSYTILPEKITKTVEREMDFLYMINEQLENKFLLHLEFQSNNDKNMLYRLGVYHGLTLAKYKIPIRHVVVYVGKRKPTMKHKLRAAEVFSEFDLINIYGIDATKFYNSQVPEVIILALLAAFPKDQTETILRHIVMQLKKSCKTNVELNKYIQQLFFFSKLRNLEKITHKIINDMPIRYDITKDYAYLQGIAQSKKEIAKFKEEVAKSEAEKKLLYRKLLALVSIEEIVKEFQISIEYLQTLKDEMDNDRT